VKSDNKNCVLNPRTWFAIKRKVFTFTNSTNVESSYTELYVKSDNTRQDYRGSVFGSIFGAGHLSRYVTCHPGQLRLLSLRSR